ncbi:MAG: S-layer homology domain-containing protein [Ruminococcaceae bacterium]|nr:S-layer homology domain-containing protein [Oscillospiraceae bacterium]
MKRILTLIIAISLVMSSFCISPVSASGDSYSDKAIEVVATLGLMNNTLVLDPDAQMTRGDLVDTVLNLCDTKTDSASSVFTDLEDTHVHYNAIMTAYNMGLVAGFGDGTVRPDDVATVSQAMKLIYYALGYKEFLAQTNSPAMAVERAGVGSFGDTNSSAPLTAKKLASLMVEAGESYPLEVQKIGNDGDISFQYYNAKETVLERYYDISRVEGVVTSAGGMNLEIENNYNADWIVIAGNVLRKEHVSAEPFFGQRVVAYYRQYKDLIDKRLVCLYSYNNNVTEINSEIYDGYTDGKLYYEVGDMKYDDIEVDFSSVDMFVNNVMVQNANESYFDIDSGKITLIDNNMDRVIDVIVVVEYETYVVNAVNVSLNTIIGKYNEQALLLDDYANVSIVSETGEVIYIEELSQNDVLSVVKAGDKSSISIVYAITELRGTIEEAREDNGRLYLTISGKEYRVTDDCKNIEETLLTPGRKGIFPLNASGEISTFISIGDIAHFGYVIQTKQTRGLKSVVMSKILDEDGSVNVYYYDKNVKIDGSVYNAVEAVSRLNGVLVSFTTDDEGLIKTVDTPFETVVTGEGNTKVITYEGLGEEESHLNSLQMFYDGYDTDTLVRYKSSSGILGGKVALDTSAPIFVIPTGEAATDNDYKAYTIENYLRGDSDYQLVAYKMSDRSLIADATLVYTEVTGSNETPLEDTQPIFVEKATRVLDKYGDPVTRITGYYRTEKRVFYLTDELAKEVTHQVRGGDIIKLTYNSENYIKGIQVIYSYADRELKVANPTQEDITAVFRIMNANVYRKEDTVIISTTQNLVPGTDYEGEELSFEEVRNVSKYRMHIYDEKTETISAATAADIIAFKDTGSICSEIVVYDRYGDPFDMYIFKY